VNDPDRQYVSRGGEKLAAALDAFGIHPAGLVCADLGASTGGFTDCLLQRGAARVYAVDTAYGQLAWKLRRDDRVTVMERTNALHVQPPPPEGVDLVVVDLGWTKQDKAVPAALRWLKRDGKIITLIKPHYESGRHTLDDTEAEAIAGRVLADMPALGVRVIGQVVSPLRGGKGGNAEYLALLTRAAT
jgi:23S rRNA (cytidine1920-2'-O)/16S rRNA (cytidine1409-2'-O)-methyltransferase